MPETVSTSTLDTFLFQKWCRGRVELGKISIPVAYYLSYLMLANYKQTLGNSTGRPQSDDFHPSSQCMEEKKQKSWSLLAT